MPKTVVYLLLALIILSCNTNDQGLNIDYQLDECNETIFISDSFDVELLPIDKRLYATTDSSFTLPELVDSNELALSYYGGVLFHHPVKMVQHALTQLDVFVRTGDSTCWNSAVEHFKFVHKSSISLDGAKWVQYNFDFHFYQDDWMITPWYSAISQGQILSLSSRLYELSNDSIYLEAASQYYESFKPLKGQSDLWISCVDRNGYYWLEEYPCEQPSHVLNGMIYAAYGLYDYWVISGSSEVFNRFCASVKTISDHKELFRKKDEPLLYCLKFDYRNQGYQDILIHQFHELDQLVPELDFGEFAEVLRQDQKVYSSRN